MKEKIDLSKCKAGDRAVTRDGKEVRLVGYTGTTFYPYVFKDSRGVLSTYAVTGRFFADCESPRDIVRVSPCEESEAKAKTAERKPAAPKLPLGKVRVAGCVGKFLAVESSKNDGVVDLESLTSVHGPFDSIPEAEKYICEDAIDVFKEDSGNSVDDLENRGSDCLIVEIKKAVRPMPTVKVGCEIKTLADDNAKDN